MIVAERLLKLQQSNTRLDIPIRIFAPEMDDTAWKCQYQIDWPEGQETRNSWGTDSMQALVLALQMIGADIYTSSYHESGRLLFEKPGQGYGFPVPESLRAKLVGNDAIYGA